MLLWIKTGGKVVLAFLICAVLWEILLRAFFIQPIINSRVAELGWLPKNARGLHTIEGRGHVVCNEYGFRDSSIGAKTAGQTRVLVLGDSNIQARQVSQHETMPSRLQERLDAQLAAQSEACRVRVFNGGRVGATPAFHVGLAEPYKKLFQPDWVVIQIEDDRWEMMLSSASHEVQCMPDGDSFRIVYNWKRESRRRTYKLLKKSRLLHTALYEWSVIRWDLMHQNGGEGNPEGNPEGEVAEKRPQKTTAEALAEKEQKRKQIARLMDWTIEQLRRDYPNLVIVHMPSYDQAEAKLAPPSHEERDLAKLCRRYGIPLVEMRKAVAEDYARTGIPPYGFANTLPWTGHVNAHGHKIIAQSLADYFADKLCVAGKS